MQVAGEIKVANLLTLRWEDYCGLSSGLMVITSVLKSGSRRQGLREIEDGGGEPESMGGTFRLRK